MFKKLLGSVRRGHDHFGEDAAHLIRTLIVIHFFHSEVGVFSAVVSSRACFVGAAAVSLAGIFPGAVVVASILASMTLVRQRSLVHVQLSAEMVLVLLKQGEVLKI